MRTAWRASLKLSILIPMDAASGGRDFVAVLEEEQDELEELLKSLPAERWSSATPAVGWDVRDQVSHLADTEEIAHDTATGGPRALAAETERLRNRGGVIPYGVARGRQLTPAEVLDWWTSAARHNRAALRGLEPTARVPWGLGMGLRAFVTARLMEHWAHGLDIRAAVGAPAVDTERLQHIAWIGHSALPYAFRVAGVEPPAGHTLRLELLGPGGETWTYGPSDATDSITGAGAAWCRRAVQRIDPAEARTSLEAEGPLAQLAIEHARAFL